MKKRISESKKKNRILNKLGMTYVELLCALSLLSLIVVMFTPMLLSSYETLYNAGEKTEEIYDSKTELEQGLARRDEDLSISLNMNLKVSAEVLFENINVIGRKIVATAQESMATVFGQVRPSLKLISPAHVNDDKTSHEILIQTKGLEFKEITSGKFPYEIDADTGKSGLPEDTIHIEVVIPDKTKGGGGNNNSGNSGATYEEAVYSGTAGYCNVEVTDSAGESFTPDQNGVIGFTNESDDGRIGMIISNDKLDFTYSPLKIQVYYVNTRGKTRTVCEYIYIDPPTLMFAGETTEADYYTSAGVQEISEESTSATGEIIKTSKYVLEAMDRTMRTSNSVYLTQNSSVESSITVGSPSQLGVEIKNIRWISNDETAGLDPYYVMTGTGGTIYRMYNYTSDSTEIYEHSTGHSSKNTSTAYYGGTSHNYIDQAYDITTGHRVYPSLWSGDYSHIFEYTSAKKRVAYGSSANYSKDETWLTSVSRAGLVGDDKYNVFSLKTQFAYYYNGDGTGHKFGFKNGRTISYILTERGWPLRLYGVIGPADPDEDYFEDFAAVWDKNQITVNIRSSTIYKNASEVLAFHYKHQNDEQQSDYVYAPLRIKSLASYPLTANTDSLVNYMDTADDYENSTSMAKISTVRRGQGESNTSDRLNGASLDVNITDAIYIPSTTTTEGTTFYVGTVHGYANIIQTDKIEAGAAEHHEYTNFWSVKDDTDISDNGMVGRWYQNRSNYFGTGNACSYPKGAITDYLILSNEDGTATYVAKYNDGDYSRMGAGDRQSQLLFCTNYISENDAKITSENATTMGLSNGSDLASKTAFFLPNQSRAWTYLYLDDVNFTFGYASNRERVYTNITYDGTLEYTRSFERLYWRSHYGKDAAYTKENGELTFQTFNANQSVYKGESLDIHQANRAVSDSNGNLQNGNTYLNSVNNDYYNVWFPGEMYNLTQVASKDGVTVAVGYAVAGSTYQYAHAADNSVTSTALGGIYNDGVLSAMVEGQDSAFVNLLYYKDNESFDGNSLSGYSQYKAYTNGYGTHSRDSIQFTAVDIFVEERELSDTKNQLNYWAVYGDNKGRAYLSLVATGTATGSGSGDPDDEDSDYHVDKDIQLVSYISDQVTSMNGAVPLADESIVSNMIEIEAGDATGMYTLDVAFSKITSIEAKDELVIITGQKAPNMPEIIVVGECKDGVWSFKRVQNGNFSGEITDATIANGYYYFVGYEGTGKSFLGAISLDRLKEIGNAQILDTADNEGYSYDKDEVMWVYTSENAKMNTIAGRAAS
ncbi:MAG: hypothetical protein IJN94_05135 [Clostridia bacterium]|nr:hypothetical protein [Clostridia bacterium]